MTKIARRNTKAAARGTPHAARVGPVADAGCACPVPGEPGGAARVAVAVDADIKARNLTRLRRIEGQVRGLQRMIEQDRYCADVMTQISSVQEALRSVGRELMRNHLKHCATAAIRAGDGEANAMYDELIDLMYSRSR
ncbi:MAG TPA: metal-sensitive transcriptional regulator [Gemmatimonadaceae bacterium]|jgi:DNA-binding FrmR family transcriptional regulator